MSKIPASSPKPEAANSDRWAPDEAQQNPADTNESPPWTREQAQQWRAQQPPSSVWQVVRWQLGLVLLVPWLALWMTQQPSVAWSVFYGGLCIVLPTAVMAYGVTSSGIARLAQRSGAGARLSVASVFFWEGVKLLLALAMLWTAPRWIPDLSWLGLLVGLAVTLKAYWLVFWRQKRSRMQRSV